MAPSAPGISPPALYFPAMRPSFPTPSCLIQAAALGMGLLACRAPASAEAPPAAPPSADFVLAAGDSAFWVTSAQGSVRVRGAPLELARVDGRFYELYVVDDDRSYGDATFIGQRVYRRDLLRGDSAIVYEDSIVPRLAREYARRYPEDARLGDGEEPSDDPRWSAIASLDLTDVHGHFVSFDTHTDVERDDAPRWHTSRRGVIDVRHRGPVALAAVVGAGGAIADVERRRRDLVSATLDSVRGSRTDRGEYVATLLPFYRLDPRSFSLTTLDGAPAVAFALAGSGDGDAGHLFPLPPIRIGEPAWWPEVAATLPVTSANGSRDVWRHAGYEVVVHYDTSADAARLVLRDSTSREWAVARVPGPASRIFWLDAPAIEPATRHALLRAFEESTLYDEGVRTASWRPGYRPPARPRLAPHRRPRLAPRA